MIRIKGLAGAYRQLQNARKRSDRAAKKVAVKLAKDIQKEARAGVPVDLGKLKASIGVEETESGAVVYVGEAYGAMQEFGTGLKVDVPAELVEEAKKFQGYKEGNFGDFVEAMRGWCVRHGIDPRAAYPIAASILRNGLEPKPYFHPAIQKNKPKLEQYIREELERLSNG